MTSKSAPIAEGLPEPRGAEPLRRSEERYKLLVESVRDYAVFLLDSQGRVETWNPGAERIKGYSPAEIIGKPMSQFYAPEDQARGLPAHLLRLARENGRIENEGWRVRKDGTRFWADVIITAIVDASGKLIGYSKVTRDLTDRKSTEDALRDSEARFRMLVESVKDYAIFMLDPEGRIQTWNTGAERIIGYPSEEILGRHFSIFYPEGEGDRADQEIEVATREGRFEEEGWRVRKDGSRFWSNVVLTAIRNHKGELLGFAKITRDLSDRKEADEERLRLARANEAIRMRDEFLSIASHELKTPLTALQLHLQSVQERLRESDPKLVRKIDSAARSTERLSALIEALLDVARISTGRFTLQLVQTDLSQVVREAAERLYASAVHSGCTYSVEVEPDIQGTVDVLRVEQVITNLVSNAIKYAAGTPVSVSLSSQGAFARLEVRDLGPGIPEKDLSRIFGRFERAASMAHYGGLGLGLYVTHQIVEAHRGKIRAQNLPEGGTVFIVEFPLSPAGAATTRAEEQQKTE